MSFETLMAEYEQREVADAEAAGMTLVDYRAKMRAEEAERFEREERERVLKEKQDRRARCLAPMAKHMADAAREAVIADTLRVTPALTFVKGWLQSDNRPPIALLTGHTGCGKTVAAAWGLCRTSGGEYVHARDLAARYTPYSHDQVRGIEPLDMESGLIVLDDMGTERRTRDDKAAADDRFTEAFAMILEMRQSSGTPTIITTNLTPALFIARYCQDARDKSRFVSMAAVCEGGRTDLRATT